MEGTGIEAVVCCMKSESFTAEQLRPLQATV